MNWCRTMKRLAGRQSKTNVRWQFKAQIWERDREQLTIVCSCSQGTLRATGSENSPKRSFSYNFYICFFVYVYDAWEEGHATECGPDLERSWGGKHSCCVFEMTVVLSSFNDWVPKHRSENKIHQKRKYSWIRVRHLNLRNKLNCGGKSMEARKTEADARTIASGKLDF